MARKSVGNTCVELQRGFEFFIICSMGIPLVEKKIKISFYRTKNTLPTSYLGTYLYVVAPENILWGYKKTFKTVIGCNSEPIPGWTDNVYGIAGVFAGKLDEILIEFWYEKDFSSSGQYAQTYEEILKLSLWSSLTHDAWRSHCGRGLSLSFCFVFIIFE